MRTALLPLLLLVTVPVLPGCGLGLVTRVPVTSVPVLGRPPKAPAGTERVAVHLEMTGDEAYAHLVETWAALGYTAEDADPGARWLQTHYREVPVRAGAPSRREGWLMLRAEVVASGPSGVDVVVTGRLRYRSPPPPGRGHPVPSVTVRVPRRGGGEGRDRMVAAFDELTAAAWALGSRLRYAP